MANVIYKIINIQNQKFYVGSAVDFDARRNRHLNALRKGDHHCAHLQAAWRKYGAGSFIFVVVQEVPAGQDLLEAENVWLHAHAGEGYCYNTARDAKAPMRNPSPETRAKMRAAMIGRFAGERHYRYGKTVSDDVRKKIGDSQRGKPKAPRTISAEGMEKIRAAAAAGHYSSFAGRQHTEETKKRLGEGIVVLPSGQRFDTITEMRAALGVSITSVHRALKSNKPIAHGPHAGLSFQYQDPTREQERLRQAALTVREPKKTGRPAGQANASQVKAVCAMPENVVYPSVAAYIRASGRSRKKVYEVLNGTRVEEGWTLTYVSC